jgi:hypothetical protein
MRTPAALTAPLRPYCEKDRNPRATLQGQESPNGLKTLDISGWMYGHPSRLTRWCSGQTSLLMAPSSAPAHGNQGLQEEGRRESGTR